MAALRDRVPTRDLTDDEFQKLLYNIDKNLEEQELLILKYLCRDKSIKLKYGPLENCKNCLQLFDLLQRRVYLNKGNLNLLIELLSYINCTELIDRIEEKCGTIEKKKIVSLYRRMVLDCLYLISDSEFDQFKSYTRRVLGGSMEKLKFQIQMMNALEKKGCIGPEKVDYLLEMSEQLERSDMSQEVKRYQREKKLEETFINNLGFTAWEKSPTDNLTAEEMRRVMDEVSKEDHSEFDCFVCCILSHGNCGKVTGVDGNPCEIMDIARIMSTSNCPSLASKPKLFFIQACQGGNYDDKFDFKMYLNINSSSITYDNDPSGDSQFIPEDADFLFAFASSPGRKAKLNMESGSVYMSKLTEILNNHYKDLHIKSL